MVHTAGSAVNCTKMKKFLTKVGNLCRPCPRCGCLSSVLYRYGTIVIKNNEETSEIKIFKQIKLIAFSRNERTHPNLVSQASQAREIEIFCGLQTGRPCRFCRGFGPRFRVHLSRHACSLLWLLSLFSTFGGFL